MANSTTHGALPFPIKGCRFTLLVPYFNSSGVPTDPTTPDTEVSKDAGAFADCTEEVTTISGSNGTGYITLTGDELDASVVAVAAKAASGPNATLLTLYPRVLAVLESGTAQAGAAGTITLASGAAAYDLTGCIVRTTGGTGGAGGSGKLNNQARVITAYNTSTKVATVVPNWETTPDATTTYEVLLNPTAPNAVTGRFLRPTTDGRTLDVSSGGEAGVDWANVGSPSTTVSLSGTTVATVTTTTTATNVTTVNGLAAGVITATSIATDAITAAKVADGTIDAATFANDAITAAAIAADAIGSSELATTAATEIAGKVWDELRSGHTTVGTFGEYTNANLTLWKGTAPLDLTTGWVQVSVQNTLTQLSLIQRVNNLGDQTGMTSTQAKLDTSASSTDNVYRGQLLRVWSGTGIDEVRAITAYNGTTKIVTVDRAWEVQPATGDGYTILAADLPAVDSTGKVGITAAAIQAIWDALTSAMTTASSIGKKLADWALGTDSKVLLSANAQTGVTIPTVTVLTNGVTVTTNNDKTGYSVSATGLDLVLIDTKTLPAAVRYIAASAAGKVSGAGTGTETFLGLDGSTTRLQITVDSSGNRSAITYG